MYPNPSFPSEMSDAAVSDMTDQLYVEVPAKPEQVGMVRHKVADFTRKQSWGADDIDALILAVGEACNNAVNYGGKDFSDPLLVVSCLRISPDELRVDVCNQGNGFHPDFDLLTVMPTAGEYATHGRGFGLMMALVDDVQVLSDGKSTTVRLRKRRTS